MIISAVFVVLALGIGLLTGIFYQTISQIIDRRRFTPQGQLYDIGGFRLHLHCMGQGKPTVVMDAGAGASSVTWGLIPYEIAKITHVCIYDRAGFGWSDPNLKVPRTSQQSVDELHALLTKAEVEPPYILVGHSLGGGNMRLYANQYPEDVVGVVLVDSVHENQMTPEMWLRLEKGLWFYRLLGVASRVGVLRLVGEANLVPMLRDIKRKIKSYPLTRQSLFSAFKSSCYRPCYWASLSSELANMRRNFEQIKVADSLGSLPLVVLSQGSKSSKMSEDRFLQWQALQQNLTQLSSNSRQIIAEESGHWIPLDQPKLIVDAVFQLLATQTN